METTFKLTTKDRHGQRKQGGDRVTVDITQPDGTHLPASVKDEGMFMNPDIDFHQGYQGYHNSNIRRIIVIVLMIKK